MTSQNTAWWQRLSRFILRISGWTLVEEMPAEKKYVMVGAHHTSGWDWVMAVLIMASLGLKPRWVGKEALFRGIAGPIVRWAGGISVVRGARQNFVGQIADVYKSSKELVIALAPEGTRKHVDHWKTGFYHIALEAKVSVAMAFVDYSKKICGVGGHFLPSGDLESDMKILRKFYNGVAGKFPEKQGVVQLKG